MRVASQHELARARERGLMAIFWELLSVLQAESFKPARFRDELSGDFESHIQMPLLQRLRAAFMPAQRERQLQNILDLTAVEGVGSQGGHIDACWLGCA